MDEERYNAIDRYLANEMDVAERQAFEEQLRQDADLAEKVSIYTEASRSLAAQHRAAAGEEAFRDTIASITKEETPHSGQPVRIRWYAWAAAACLALAAIAVIYSIINKPEYKAYAHFPPLELTQRGNSTTLQRHAQDAFNTQDYNQAVVYLNTLLQNDPDNTELTLYKGIALLELGRTAAADSVFFRVSTTPSVYQHQAQWLLALSALKQKDYKRCAALLEAIPEDAEEYTPAQHLLKDL